MSTNYRTDYFENVDLTPIVGEPDFVSLNRLKNELKSNAQNVPCTLGGGNHGFLGLVLTPAEYNLIAPGTPFVMQPHPGPLLIPAGTTNVQARVIENNHTADMKLYDQCVAMEKALKQQIVKAIHEDWLDPIRNPTTHAIEHDIPYILGFLFDQHGNVSAAALSDKEDKVKNMNYQPANEPIDKVFNTIQDLAEFAAAANSPYNEQ